MALNTGYLTALQTDDSNENYTPYYAVDPILKYLPKDKIIWCPCDKRNDEIITLIKNKEINKATLEAMLEASLKHYRNRDRDINKDLIKEGVKGEKNINLDKIEISEDLKPILIEWLEYKKSRKEAYKSEKSLQALANELTRLSNNDQTTARAIIQKSMPNIS